MAEDIEIPEKDVLYKLILSRGKVKLPFYVSPEFFKDFHVLKIWDRIAEMWVLNLYAFYYETAPIREEHTEVIESIEIPVNWLHGLMAHISLLKKWSKTKEIAISMTTVIEYRNVCPHLHYATKEDDHIRFLLSDAKERAGGK